MKTISKLLMVSCVSAALFTGCSDDDIVENVVPIVPGEEIAFGASARFEMDDKSSRTIYGPVSSDKTYQTVRWEDGDMIKIWCDEAAQAKVADYKVVLSDSDNDIDSEIEGSEHTSMHLEKQGAGLQWSDNKSHTFYAVYPGDFVKEAADENGEDFTPRVNLSGSKLLTAYVPTQQSPAKMEYDETTGNYIAHPNMKYAYMVAKTIYDVNEDNQTNGVSLFFQPIVTAVELQLTASQMSLDGTDRNMIVTSVSLQADADGQGEMQHLAGEFTIDMANCTCTGTEHEGAFADHEYAVSSSSSSSSSSNIVTMQFAGTGGKAVSLTEGKTLTLTLFVNSLATFEDGNDELKLLVTYNAMGASAIKTLNLKKEMVKFKKYAFKNIYLPKLVTDNSNASNWISKLPDNVIMSQLSIPVAGNAGSYISSDVAYKEQLVDFETQWNYGVRGFELVTSYNNGTNRLRPSGEVANLGECKIVCNKTKLDLTFGDIASQIVGKLSLDENANECAVIVCTYQSCCDSRSGDNYISALTKYVEGYPELKGKLVLYDPTETLDHYRGKICLIGRITQEGEDAEMTLTNVPEYLTNIQGWGSLKDRWNRRFPGYAVWIGDNGSRADGTTATEFKCVEDRLWNTDGVSAVQGYPTDTGEPNFYYPVQIGANNPIGNGAWVQEWSRVADGTLVNVAIGNKYITWPNSIDEKKQHVEKTFVMTKDALLAGDKTVFINSLAGFYIASDANSVRPFYYWGTTNRSGLTSTNNTTDDASGGDFATYNAEINQFAYEYISEQAAANETGPMGLVIMDYIGQDEAGEALPGMIWQNNFKVPLKIEGETVPVPGDVNVGGGENSEPAEYENGGNAIEPAAWE